MPFDKVLYNKFALTQVNIITVLSIENQWLISVPYRD